MNLYNRAEVESKKKIEHDMCVPCCCTVIYNDNEYRWKHIIKYISVGVGVCKMRMKEKNTESTNACELMQKLVRQMVQPNTYQHTYAHTHTENY